MGGGAQFAPIARMDCRQSRTGAVVGAMAQRQVATACEMGRHRVDDGCRHLRRHDHYASTQRVDHCDLHGLRTALAVVQARALNGPVHVAATTAALRISPPDFGLNNAEHDNETSSRPEPLADVPARRLGGADHHGGSGVGLAGDLDGAAGQGLGVARGGAYLARCTHRAAVVHAAFGYGIPGWRRRAGSGQRSTG
ncbi:hypothetical protein D3C81_1512090 [compost metagenome]